MLTRAQKLLIGLGIAALLWVVVPALLVVGIKMRGAPDASITGRVTDSSGNPIPGAMFVYGQPKEPPSTSAATGAGPG